MKTYCILLALVLIGSCTASSTKREYGSDGSDSSFQEVISGGDRVDADGSNLDVQEIEPDSNRIDTDSSDSKPPKNESEGGLIDDDFYDGRPDFYDELDFFGLLTLGVEVFYEIPESIDEFVFSSDIVVMGRFESVTRGRTLWAPFGSFSADYNSVVTVSVERTLAGDARETVYVELDHSKIVNPEDLDDKLYSGPVILFLVDSSDYSAISSFDEGLGIPEGETLFLLNLPIGIIVEDNARIVFPLESEFEFWPSVETESLEELASLIESLDT